ncbi:MAG: alpha/beta hydrolase [SAR202 cluster bacterium]|jgi:pimeloyl-ACP methyl ester carboxylesterase|nr:alpha/beta hydrolase [SAR202 cluster bacterium]MDP7102124.1 alpha/beta hydrolase [SAR202 cluster bacterium]MDP7412346.1 alpha/beta hydrolase [SAR202 cluster bacterium]HJO83694.1 alpha/beta hydrolase [SAR202 cluster bacterium]|tara:strand:+ start:3483 stop:4265 length:783 start_codon:yes stop_codon:yes gene_type:complete
MPRPTAFGCITIEWSTAGPPLIFIHGVTSNCKIWDMIAPHFIDRYSVMAIDLRGHGLSDNPESGYAWETDYAADVVDFIATQLVEPAIVVGHSLGAVVAAPVAVQAGERVRAIVLEDPPSFPREGPVGVSDHFKPAFAAKRMPFDQRVEALMEMRGTDREAATARAESFEAMSEQVLVELMDGETAYRSDDLLPKVSCPVLAILGNPSRGGAVDWADRPLLQRLLRGAEIVEWPDVGHLVHIDQPERFVAEIDSFFERLS